MALTFACWSGVRSSARVKCSKRLPRFCCQRLGRSLFFAAGSCASPIETVANRATHAALSVINRDFIVFLFLFFRRRLSLTPCERANPDRQAKLRSAEKFSRP